MSLDSVPRDITINNRFNKDREQYFKPHDCSLANTLRYKYAIRCGRVRAFFFDLVAINFNDVRARYMFKSYASISAEKYRHFTEHPFAIHPFSKLRFWAQVIVFICVCVMKSMMSFWISNTRPSEEDTTHKIILSAEIIYIFINIPVNALSGYVDGKNSQNIVLDNWKILKHYSCTWMIVDASAVLSACYDSFRHAYYSYYPVILALTELQRLVIFCYARDICTVLKIGMSTRTALELVLFLTSYLSWNIVFQFALEYYMEGEYQPAQPRACSWITIGKLWDEPGHVRHMYSLLRAVELLRKNSNLNLLQHDGCFEIFTIISFIVAQCLILHCSFKYMLALFGSQSAKMKYYIMSQQIHTYMNQRRLPPRIKKKILKFYAIRFRSHFFVESTMLDFVSGQLHEDIIMHTGRQLVREVTFLKQLPWAALIEISLKFQLAIFIEGDIIYKINTIGDSMYFINKGTVAIYSESGCELAHLDDGDHFGEMTLMTKQRQRLVTAVAVTNCELFSLSRESFQLIERYRTAYDELKKMGTSRVQWVKMMDDQYKAQLKDWRETK